MRKKKNLRFFLTYRRAICTILDRSFWGGRSGPNRANRSLRRNNLSQVWQRRSQFVNSGVHFILRRFSFISNYPCRDQKSPVGECIVLGTCLIHFGFRTMDRTNAANWSTQNGKVLSTIGERAAQPPAAKSRSERWLFSVHTMCQTTTCLHT